MSYSLQLSPKKIEQLQQYYKTKQIEPVPHSIFCAKIDGVRIQAYASGKVLFQGKNEKKEAARWEQASSTTTKETKKACLKTASIIGSDEVGNGSYFGPLVVVAAYVPKQQIASLERLGVKDSKLLSDEKMQALFPLLQQKVQYKALLVSPQKYNQIQPQYNAVAMKVLLHEQALALLEQRLVGQPIDALLIDQFTSEKNFYHYLGGKERLQHPLLLKTKAEQEHIAVATASIIARVLFLQALTTLEKQYGLPFPSGAGAKVDHCAARFIEHYGEKELAKVAKLHFKNTSKAKTLVQIKKG